MGFEAWHQRFEKVINQPHNDETMWFLRDCTRQAAENYLKGAPTGTFLIRARSAGHYALSIVCNNSVNHCIIYKTEDGYGFAAPYNIYVSLKKLVKHYACNSLEEHNDALTTTLRIPVEYWLQNKEYILQQMQEELELERQQQQQHNEQQQQQMLLTTAAPQSLLTPNTTMQPSAPIPMPGGVYHVRTGSSSLVGNSIDSSSNSLQTPPNAAAVATTLQLLQANSGGSFEGLFEAQQQQQQNSHSRQASFNTQQQQQQQPPQS